MANPLRGYFPIMATPYTEEGEVDLASVERLVEYLIESGAHGMSPNGGDSEAPHLSVGERNAIIDVVVKTNGGRTPVLVGTSAHTVEETLELNQHAQMAGADSIFVHPGWGRSGLSIEEVVDFYDRICREIEIPVMIHGTADMDLTVVEALLERFPIITHIKEETSHGPKLRQYVEKLGNRVTVFAPGLHYPGELGWGAMGAMPSCVAPRGHARIFDLWQEGSHDEARGEWNRILPLLFWRWHTAAGEAGKVYLKQVGIFAHAYCRQQVTVPGKHSGAEVSFGSLTLEEADRQEMLEILETLGDPPF